jgi:hypothetical protein
MIGKPGNVPHFIEPDSTSEADAPFQFMCQYADRIVVWHDAGVPLAGLARAQSAMMRKSPFRECRQRKRMAAIEVDGVNEFTD